MASRLALADGTSLVLLVNGVDHILLAADTTPAVTYAAFSTPQQDGETYTRMIGY